MMDWALWVMIVVASMAGGIAILWTVGGYYHVKYYIRRRHEPESWKCQPRRFLRPEQVRKAMTLSTVNLALGGLISGTLIYSILQGWDGPAIYYDVADYGLAWTLGGTLVYFVIADGLAYYAHRFMHVRFMFRHIHRWHHRYVATSPWVVTAMHPVEFLVFQVVTLGPLFIIPFHYLSVIVVLVYILAFNVIDHSGVDLHSRWPWQGPTRYHDDHHVYFHVNFGQHLMFWDRFHGTLRRKGRKYGVDVFGGKGAASGRESATAAEFVEY